MFKDNLKKRRLELGMSQEELAYKAGYSSRSSISKLESGVADISKKKLLLLANALDITPEELITESVDLNVHHNCNLDTRKKNKHVVLIQAGGKSTRNLLNVPNQFIVIDDKPVIVYVLEAYERHPLIDEIYISCVYGWEKVLHSYIEKYDIKKVRSIITGGNTILDSVRLAFNKIKKELQLSDVIILQESTRPMIDVSLISKLILNYEQFGSSVIVKAMRDYVLFEVKDKCKSYLDRNNMYSIESPEAYSAGLVADVLSKSDKELRDDGSCFALLLYRNGIPIHFCENNSNNMKVVRQEDSYIFKTVRSLLL